MQTQQPTEKFFPIIGAILTTVAGAYLTSSAERKGQKEQNQHNVEMAREQGNQERLSLSYGLGLNDYYTQLNTQRRRDARGAMFDKFSGMGKVPTRPQLVSSAPVAPSIAAPTRSKG